VVSSLTPPPPVASPRRTGRRAGPGTIAAGQQREQRQELQDGPHRRAGLVLVGSVVGVQGESPRWSNFRSMSSSRYSSRAPPHQGGPLWSGVFVGLGGFGRAISVAWAFSSLISPGGSGWCFVRRHAESAQEPALHISGCDRSADPAGQIGIETVVREPLRFLRQPPQRQCRYTNVSRTLEHHDRVRSRGYTVQLRQFLVPVEELIRRRNNMAWKAPVDVVSGTVEVDSAVGVPRLRGRPHDTARQVIVHRSSSRPQYRRGPPDRPSSVGPPFSLGRRRNLQCRRPRYGVAVIFLRFASL
jgi:hypothetical protein